jgi:hypothetical protein
LAETRYKPPEPRLVRAIFPARAETNCPEEYQDDPDRCCPWCTENQRRRAVHAGNDRKLKEEMATAAEKCVTMIDDVAIRPHTTL